MKVIKVATPILLKKLVSFKECAICSEQFVPKSSSGTTKYCPKCKVNSNKQAKAKKIPKKKVSNKAYPDVNLSTGTTGAISELIVCAKLMEEGWHVYRCQSPNGPFDIVAVRDLTVRRIEVRTGKVLPSGFKIWAKKCHKLATEYAVYFPQNSTIEYHPIDSIHIVKV